MTEQEHGAWRRDLALGLSLAMFFLWIPLMLPQALSFGQNSAAGGAPGFVSLLLMLAGFSSVQALDRFAPKALWRRWRLWSCVGLLILSLLFLFVRGPAVLRLFMAFLASVLVSVQMLPILKKIRGMQSAIYIFCIAASAGAALASSAQVLFSVFGDSPLLTVVLCCLLLTSGLVMFRFVEKTVPDGPDEPVITYQMPDNRLISAACCVGALLSCLITCVLSIRGYHHGGAPDGPYPLFVLAILFVAAVTLAALLAKGYRWTLPYLSTAGLSLGGLSLFSPPDNSATPYMPTLFLLLAFCCLAFLTVFYLYYFTSSLNRSFLLGLGYMTLFMMLWLFIQPELNPAAYTALPSQSADVFLLAVAMLLVPLIIIPFFISLVRKPAAPEESLPEPANPILRELELKPEIQLEPASVDQSALFIQLTMTEKRVYELILCGYSNQQMADAMYVSINTIKFHIKNILGKAGATKKAQLVDQFIRSAGRLPDKTIDVQAGR